jgi:hypothetical protein
MFQSSHYWEALWTDRALRELAETCEQAFSSAFMDEISKKLSTQTHTLPLDTPIFPATNRYPHGLLDMHIISKYVKDVGIGNHISARYMSTILEQAAYKTDPDGELYNSYLRAAKLYAFDPTITEEKLNNLTDYTQKYVKEFTCHYVSLTHNFKGYELNTYLTWHPLMDKYLNATGYTPLEKECAKDAVHLVGRFNAKVNG